MIRVGRHNQIKSLGMLAIVLWLLTFQAIHQLSHHAHGHSHSVHTEAIHHHPQYAIPDGHGDVDDNCKICELISLPFTFSESWQSTFYQIFEISPTETPIVSSSYLADFLLPRHRGPPSIA